MPVVPMFPLQSVLLPGMPLPLRIFEPRYRALFDDVMAADASFGVVLIERGGEVGGGDHRFARGTFARVRGHRDVGDSILVAASGAERFEVVRWLEDDPYPRAEVRELPPLEWTEDQSQARASAERDVRRLLATASEFVDVPWSPDEELADDPVLSTWQLAGIAPLGTLDRYALLTADTLPDLYVRLRTAVSDADELLRLSALPGDDGEDLL
ncbi:LON peptidase substrate-binding domain-containing protein [Microbacterium sp. LRZ72]|uniref:LON peptidase substrate-binding domain-containing protein n=1 Tax=Microbacterium sp. LRZ72 TaxID=2942481 RepID=UPI0029A4152D|nr:LON peptidase substrate-binding domain-containing protein [Microbacterium sp. LRZ72]MDX2377964.1 LON peptidase substrate-binding domain-containing protein [Microbacterium sp. LRZ72]